MTSERTLKVWLRRELTNSENGHFQLEGTYGHEAVVVVLDPTITSRFPKGREVEAVLAMHNQIEEAATRAFGIEGRVARVHQYYSPKFTHNLIVLTADDLSVAKA